MATYWHVYAGTEDPYCQFRNSGSAHEGAARSLFSRYANRLGQEARMPSGETGIIGYVKLVRRDWPDAGQQCCDATLTTERSVALTPAHADYRLRHGAGA